MNKLEQLKAQADHLGITYHHKAGIVKIQDAIDAHLAEHNDTADNDFGVPVNMAQVNENGQIVPHTREEFRKNHLPDQKRDLNRLIRCRVTCMNPLKREWNGEIISVGSAAHGTFKKYVPFDGREWHVPKIIYDVMRERKCTIFRTVSDERGQKIRKGRLIDEFAIDVLPNLTPKEVDNLRKEQAVANNN